MPQDEKSTEPRIVTDEDWKEQVKAEDAALDEQMKQEAPEGESGSASETSEGTADEQSKAGQKLPPPSFSTLLGLLSTQAMVAMGIVANPVSGKAEQDLDLARHFIDLLGVLEEKTKRNLTGQEADLLEATLHQLRMAFVEFSKHIGKS